MDKKASYQKLKKTAAELGAAAFGVCAFNEKKGLDFAVSMAVRLSKSVLDEIGDHPTRLYFHHYRQANGLLDHIAMRVSNLIQSAGFNALPVPASQIVDWERQTAYLSHKKIAQQAGMGWLGRNNLIVHPEFGSQIRLVTVLTDMPLEVDKPLKKTCNKCKSCIKVCPASAIKESPEDFDHMACFDKLKFFQKQRFTDQYICGICVKACVSRAASY
jgi:epoxyqueuosine reductase QueG